MLTTRLFPRLAWAVTGSGHYLRESLELMREQPNADLFVSAAADEVVRMYRRTGVTLPEHTRIFRDRTASAVPVGRFYRGHYHTLVVAPATSNTIAKAVLGISDTLVTNVLAQAGKCRVPTIVFACDTAPEMDTEAPDGMVKVYPRRIDLENVERLRGFEAMTVVDSVAGLAAAVRERTACLSESSS
ncbi:flavoprotein [Azospirillum halopraeferens]|uniref:flavoprotein n=1 Tax=Azospirillum halopraeferens TaxID=34010 RepID=UPI0004247442|nr:flavoprotein [Azospirillum halopraeferens]